MRKFKQVKHKEFDDKKDKFKIKRWNYELRKKIYIYMTYLWFISEFLGQAIDKIENLDR